MPLIVKRDHADERTNDEAPQMGQAAGLLVLLRSLCAAFEP
jgi:hypothetical protein